jgi:hypothetical protein
MLGCGTAQVQESFPIRPCANDEALQRRHCLDANLELALYDLCWWQRSSNVAQDDVTLGYALEQGLHRSPLARLQWLRQWE